MNMTEDIRVSQLARYNVMFTGPEGFFDEVVAIMAEVCQAAFAGISFMDHETHWFKAQLGFGAAERTLETTFCYRVLVSNEPLLIPELSQNEYFKTSPYVLGQPKLRSYVGVPLRTPQGEIVGALCCSDKRVNAFDCHQLRILQMLAFHVMGYLEERVIK